MAPEIAILETVHYTDQAGLSKAVKGLEKLLPPPGTDIIYFCIGTDSSTGDCFGPLTGTLLKRLGHKNVMGSLDEPIHARNLEEKLQHVPQGSYVIALDATMGSFKTVGQLQFRKGPVFPGAAFDRQLPPVGNASIVFNAAPHGFANLFALNCASLNKVWLGCNLLASSISIISYRRNKGLRAASSQKALGFK